MSKSGGASTQSKFFILAFVGLILTLVLGVLLRLTYAGHFSLLTSTFDIRRAHSHLGFYGFLFPFIWTYYGVKGLWVPRGWVLASYYVVCYLSILSFLVLSYEWQSKALSFVILIFWFVFALKNLRMNSYKNLLWTQHVLVGILFACVAVAMIAVFGALGEVELAKKMVRVFMSFLIWGVFVPFSFGRVTYSSFSPVLWFLSITFTSVFLLNFVVGFTWLLGPMGLAICLFIILYKNQSKQKRISVYWVLVSLGLLAMGMGLIPNSHQIAVAGFHLVILGPVMQSLLKPFPYKFATIFYDVALITMVTTILLMDFLPGYFTTWNFIAAISGGILLLLLVSQSKLLLTNT